MISMVAKDGCYTVPHVAANDADESLLHSAQKSRRRLEHARPALVSAGRRTPIDNSSRSLCLGEQKKPLLPAGGGRKPY